MGKGDKKTKRGKIHSGTFGARRPRKGKKPVVTAAKAKAKTTAEPKAVVKTAPKTKAKPKPAAKTAPKAKAKPKTATKPKAAAKK